MKKETKMSDQKTDSSETGALMLIIFIAAFVFNCCFDAERSEKIDKLQLEVDAIYDEQILERDEKIEALEAKIDELKKQTTP